MPDFSMTHEAIQTRVQRIETVTRGLSGRSLPMPSAALAELTAEVEGLRRLLHAYAQAGLFADGW